MPKEREPVSGHTDAQIARLCSRLFDGEKVRREELVGLLGEMRGERGSPNMKFEAAVLAYTYGVINREALVENAKRHLIDLLDHQLNVGMWSVPGPGGPISEFCPASHSKHWLRGMAMCLWAANRVAGDIEIWDRIKLLWHQLLCWALLCSTPDGQVLCAGPRATRAKNKQGEFDPKRMGTDIALDAICRMAFYNRLRPKAKKLEGDDMLGARVASLLLERGLLPIPTGLIHEDDLPRCVDQLVIGGDGLGGFAVWISGECSDTTDPGPQYGARFWGKSNITTFYVAANNTSPGLKFVDRDTMAADTFGVNWSQTWRTRKARQ